MAEPDLSKLAFYTGVNYMKKEDREPRYVDITTNGSGVGTADIVHGLLFIPDFEVGGDLNDDDRIWTGTIPYVGQSGSGGGATPVGAVMDSWITDTTLTIRLDGAVSTTYRVWFQIYRDYA